MKKASIKLPHLYERNGRFVYRRVIPKPYRALAGGISEFKRTLNTNDRNEVAARWSMEHSECEAIFNQLREGKPLADRPKLPASELTKIASNFGVSYLSSDDLLKKVDIQMMSERLAIFEKAGKPSGDAFDALFGASPITVTMGDVLAYYDEHTRDEILGLNDREISKKHNPVKLAVRRFDEFAGGDRDISKINKAFALEYRNHLISKVRDGVMQADTANKQLMHVRKILTFYFEHKNIQTVNPFAKLHLKADKASRMPFSIDHIREKWLVPNAFDGLNEEARDALLVMIDTGCGPKEICGMDAEDIKLNADIPHILIRPNEHRKLKTGHRTREIPLIGQSLTAMRSHREGFPRYRNGSGPENLSALLMKFLRKHELLQTAKHSVYGLRHSFMDRMRVHQFPDELQKYFMGHKDDTMGSRYGGGYSLAQRRDYMLLLEKDWASGKETS